MTHPASAGIGYRPPAAYLVPAQPVITGDVPGLEFHEKTRLNAAAYHARRVYPGPVGELVDRELRARAEFGHALAGDGLAPRLAAQILALRAAVPAGTREEGGPVEITECGPVDPTEHSAVTDVYRGRAPEPAGRRR
jgi:hypothetical protein